VAALSERRFRRRVRCAARRHPEESLTRRFASGNARYLDKPRVAEAGDTRMVEDRG